MSANRNYRLVVLVVAGVLGVHASEWLTFGGDAQRTGCAKDEKLLTKASLKSFGLEWKLHLDNVPKELISLTAPVVMEDVFTSKGVRDYVVVAGSSDNLYAIDADTGKLVWKKTFAAEGKSKQEPHWLCPNGLNDTPLLVKDDDDELGGKSVFVIASDGKLHGLNIVNGEDRIPPAQFVPPFSKNWSLNFHDGVIYTATSQGCNGAKSAVWAMNMKDPKRTVEMFPSKNGGIWGRAGVAIGKQGNIFAETGDGGYDPAKGEYSNTVLELTPDVKLADHYTPANWEWVSKKDLDMGNMSPVVFPFKQWELVAAAGKEGVIYLLDAKSMGGADHHTPAYRSGPLANEDVNLASRGFWGAFATWADAQGTRWLYAPAWGPPHSKAPAFPLTNGSAEHGSIMAFKVEEKDGKPVLSPAWISRDLDAPEPPVVVNGMVFALSNGENTNQLDSSGKILNSQQRASKPAGNAVLYALDATTGKELYSSGNAIPEFTHFSGLGVANGRVFVTTWASNVYAFGVKRE
jgi:outer membrane protein assembly factor BamB